MFSAHEVMHMSKCMKEAHKRCSQHGEQYIMFSNTQKTMLCINCFRDTPADARLHCVDIDTAYAQSCKKLDRAVLSICELQGSVREGMALFKMLLEELRRNMETEKNTINSFCQGMQEAIAKTHASMIMEVQRQFESKERQFRGQLSNLGTVLPVLQAHLLLCSAFSSAANKYEFLDLSHAMIDRLIAISHLGHTARPTQSSQVRTNFRAEFGQALEPWIGSKGVAQDAGGVVPGTDRVYESTAGGGVVVLGSGIGGPAHLVHHPSHPHAHHGTAGAAPSAGGPGAQSAYFHPPSRRQQSALRAKALEGEGPFSNHCRSFDAQIKDLSQQLSNLKAQMQDLHRDIVLHQQQQQRASSSAGASMSSPPPPSTPPTPPPAAPPPPPASAAALSSSPPTAAQAQMQQQVQIEQMARVERVSRECASLEEQLERHQVELERLKSVFDAIWEEQLCRIHVEQDIFQSQMNDIIALRTEVKHLSLIAHQLEPFVKGVPVPVAPVTVMERHPAQGPSHPAGSTSVPMAQGQPSDGLTSATVGQLDPHIQSLLEHIGLLQLQDAHQMAAYRAEASAGVSGQKMDCRVHQPQQQVSSPVEENVLYMKVNPSLLSSYSIQSKGKELASRTDGVVRMRSREKVTRDTGQGASSGGGGGVSGAQGGESHLPSSKSMEASMPGIPIAVGGVGGSGSSSGAGVVVVYRKVPDGPPALPPDREMKRGGVISQLIEKVRTKEDRRKPSYSEEPRPSRKSLGEGGRGGRDDERGPMATPSSKAVAKGPRGSKGDSSGVSRYGSVPGVGRDGTKSSSLYHSVAPGGSGSSKLPPPPPPPRSEHTTSEHGKSMGGAPPPPPARRSHPSSTSQYQDDGPSSSGCVDVERIETQLKEKLQDMGRSMGRMIRSGALRDSGQSQEGAILVIDDDYQRILLSEGKARRATSADWTQSTEVQVMVHRDADGSGATSGASRGQSPPAMTSERAIAARLRGKAPTPEPAALAALADAVAAALKRKQNSCESLLASKGEKSREGRRSSVDLGRKSPGGSKGGDGGSSGGSSARSRGGRSPRIQKQRSWETFPPKRSGGSGKSSGAEDGSSGGVQGSHRFCQDPNEFQGGFELKPAGPATLKKADSFEGHEEAVRTLVAAVQENRSHHHHQSRKMKPSTN
ncbi:uncharacterized protein LOC124157322 isoform X4 [Ischnura elegans]|nr:uncharacterized protein LOC124157322 isoform X4 [Ischnura elegans]